MKKLYKFQTLTLILLGKIILFSYLTLKIRIFTAKLIGLSVFMLKRSYLFDPLNVFFSNAVIYYLNSLNMC